MFRAETQFDDRARIRNQLCLPSMIGLVLLHGGLGRSIPVARRFTLQVARAAECSLNLRRSSVIDASLSRGPGNRSARPL